MRIGDEVSVPTPVMAQPLGEFLAGVCKNCEVYARVESGKVVLYMVKRNGDMNDERGIGKLFASRVIPVLPEKD